MQSETTQRDCAIRLPRDYDPEALVRDLDAVRSIDSAPQPGPYHDGEWTGVSLYSQGGKPGAMPEAAGLEPYLPTGALDHTPYFRQILDELDCPKQVVRLLTLPPGAEIGEHVDYDMNFQYGLIRLHIPIVTHPDVEFTISGQRCNWNPGELWYGDFSQPHHVKNESSITRIHLVADVEINDYVLGLFPPDFIQKKREEGISPRRKVRAPSREELKKFTCEFEVPGEILPALTIGKSLASLAMGASGQVEALDGELVVSLDGEPAFALRQFETNASTEEETSFAIVGLPHGCEISFALSNDKVTGVSFTIRGVPDDLYAARLGEPSGPNVPEQRVPFELTN